ncbi:ABC transporter ATP-binding protein [Paeniglutamicibacter psychrophenolicus]|uniref:Peptide/nickel transport system ATP-binding protein/oligopeptide transport system ATP-binding protein n=2 Tax=Paeniglutamicibacter psychrophenolicus TaxID=257454 RepID=A0ABS4W9Y8_9MICC|nr:ABC transporter ATP-binding protein [Paeniglutamicibacter psychrophenolicus]MBP2373017.1 peptide/nickel transport system ATP-binding protein/oligopeptide transport system ATP-binding protein [Paeniglutamicibacter psychrophenolicus]
MEVLDRQTRDKATAQAVLAVDGLDVDIRTPSGTVRVVGNVSFTAYQGQTLALLGESGCGKSMTAKAIAGLLDPVASVAGGTVELEGRDLNAMSPRQRREVAGPGLGIVFQDALTALNPVYTVGTQLGEAFRIHRGMNKKQARAQAIELMRRVGIPEPEVRVSAYPHQFSGGMRQRILIAMAVALGPRLLIADEPTTALDVTVQAQIMELLRRLREEEDMAVVLITHDLAVVAEEADDVCIMYAGNVVESGPVATVFSTPTHPYTKGLLESVPTHAVRGDDLSSIPGSPPELAKIPAGCVYADRCPMAAAICREVRPELRPSGENQFSACHFSESLRAGSASAPASGTAASMDLGSTPHEENQ